MLKILPRLAAFSILLPMATAVLPSTSLGQAPADRCTAPTPSQPGQNDGSAEKRRDSVGQLDACDGELKAPSVGDGGMVEPAPETGPSRVIRPGTLPPDTNPSNGTGD
ncbi:hypothetical protein [Rhizobium terrae]|uniref:hypothetical protein n=1 Tax=Rhizobium terrae TaxID=2171756 RepID=UPI0013C34DEF|nr:hypothetical protein [Rhizobium terrae]